MYVWESEDQPSVKVLADSALLRPTSFWSFHGSFAVTSCPIAVFLSIVWHSRVAEKVTNSSQAGGRGLRKWQLGSSLTLAPPLDRSRSATSNQKERVRNDIVRRSSHWVT